MEAMSWVEMPVQKMAGIDCREQSLKESGCALRIIM